jgi:transposase
MVSGEIRVQTLNHLGLIAGLVDEIGVVEEIDRKLGKHLKELISAGQAVKAMIINGLGFVSAPLYLFERFFEGKWSKHHQLSLLVTGKPSLNPFTSLRVTPATTDQISNSSSLT